MTYDTINGWFEIGGAFITLLSLQRLRRDRVMRGFHWGPTIFFTVWGLWNIIYYPSLHQIVSTIGACMLVGVNVAYLGLMYQVTRHPRYMVQWRSDLPPHHPNCKCQCVRSAIDGIIREDPTVNVHVGLSANAASSDALSRHIERMRRRGLPLGR